MLCERCEPFRILLEGMSRNVPDAVAADALERAHVEGVLGPEIARDGRSRSRRGPPRRRIPA